MTQETLKEFKDLFKSNTSKDFYSAQKKMAAMDDSIGSQAKILGNKLLKKFSALFALKSKTIAEKMINGTLQASETSLNSSLKALTGGLSLKTGVVSAGLETITTALVAENVSLIKSIPQEYFTKVTGSVMRSITSGQGIMDLIPDIQQYDGQTYRRAKNLALDQTRKAYNSINKQKLIGLGVKKFEWIHSGGGQVPRKWHVKIDGVVFSFENLEREQAALGVPESDRGLPSWPVNCRCTMLPVIEFED